MKTATLNRDVKGANYTLRKGAVVEITQDNTYTVMVRKANEPNLEYKVSKDALNMELSPELKNAFEALACRLSPENLHCDGEISRAQAEKRYRQIMREWRMLENKAGRKVSEDEFPY